KGIPARIDGARAELFLDPQQLVVLRDAIAPRRRARLDLTRVVRNREAGARRVRGLAGTMGHHRAVLARPRELERSDGFRDRPDLVDLDEDRVGDVALDSLPEAIRARDEHVVSDELDSIAELAGQLSPSLPVVLGQRILDRDDRVALDEPGPEGRHLVAA